MMARIKMAPFTYTEGLSESHVSPHMPGHKDPQVFSRLEMMKNDYQERVLGEKEQKMLKLLTQQQDRITKRINGHRTLHPPEEKAWASNWTVAKRTAGVDRAHPLKPVYPRNEPVVQRYPSANTAGSKHSLPYARSKSGPSRTDQWKELEKSEMNLEAEIRRKEALLREKLRRTEEELRRIQKEKEEAEQEEMKAQEMNDIKARLRRTKMDEANRRGNVKATKDSRHYKEQYSMINEKAEKDYPLYNDRYSEDSVKATKENPLYIDHYSEASVKAAKENPLYIDHHSNARMRVEKDSPLSLDHYSRGRLKSGKDSNLSMEQYSGDNMKARKDSPQFIDVARQYAGESDSPHPPIQSSRLKHVADSFHDLRLDAPRAQDSEDLSPSHLHNENMAQSLGIELVPCQFCGRQFMEHRLQKHAAVCEKMHSSRRKVFDSSKARAKGTDLEQYLHKKGRQPSPTPQVKPNSWRQKHESFLRTIRQARIVQDVVAKGGKISDLPPPPPEENPDYVACPHCSRRFAPRAAERHIPKCETIKSKPRPPPSRRHR